VTSQSHVFRHWPAPACSLAVDQHLRDVLEYLRTRILEALPDLRSYKGEVRMCSLEPGVSRLSNLHKGTLVRSTHPHPDDFLVRGLSLYLFASVSALLPPPTA
jgi:hypothetical protein